MKLGIGELWVAINGHKHIQLAAFRLHFGNFQMATADRISGELLFLVLADLNLWQPTDAMSLQTLMQG